MKKTLRPGDIVSDCGHIDSETSPNQQVRVLQLDGCIVHWTNAFGGIDRLPCAWIFCCVPCYIAAEGDPKRITLASRPAPHEGDTVTFDDRSFD